MSPRRGRRSRNSSRPRRGRNMVPTSSPHSGRSRRCTDGRLYFLTLATDDLSGFEERVGYQFRDRDLLTRALTHKSYSHEAKSEAVGHNETFEFLGDSVLGFVVGDLLFRNFPALDEG